MRKEYKQMMDQLSPREELVEQVLAQAGVGAELRQKRRRPMHKKKLILALAAALAGAAVSFAGLLGFVGLIVPHIMRRTVGEDSLPLLLACALGGASLLTLCDLLSRVLFAPYEIPVGIVLSLAGGLRYQAV